jgi:hypothetical protein
MIPCFLAQVVNPSDIFMDDLSREFHFVAESFKSFPVGGSIGS